MTIPAEPFAEMGLELKAKAPFPKSFTVSVANGYYGYLPTPEQHRLGGYESWVGTNRLEIEATPKITAALLRMAGEINIPAVVAEVTEAFRLAFGRAPAPNDLDSAQTFLARQPILLERERAADPERAALADFCHMLLNSN